ncbi:nucleotidyltransferase domain-containing protein [Halorarum salinum]|uniref:Nucleotidyltransferase domain-containing protein n=1 Tax=Halorarum salinum TaxID=2743089 RepID=A0A7D5LBW1_9EURY|nr:nucleotidyltransferase domain-containing protein [Halobaculum salinum]QLG62848.1 nucleotidyltransferase domain-containing protein [Halobaculum salinum]
MSEESTAAIHRNEVNQIRESKPRLHIDDVDQEHREAVRDAIEDCIRRNFQPLDPDLTVDEVYVYGSFAEGEATETFSDLDLRVILDTDALDEETASVIAKTLKHAVTTEVAGGAPFGYVDPQCYPTWSDAAEGEVVL